MNIALKENPLAAAATVAHSVMAYDRASDALAAELPIPLPLDSLALTIADVPPADADGAASYPLAGRQLEVFRFLLGLDIDMTSREYFLESVRGLAPEFSAAKLQAIAALAEVSPLLPRSGRPARRITEGELVVPILRLLEAGSPEWMTTGELVARLSALFAPFGTDGGAAAGRDDSHFSQKLRNLISHQSDKKSFLRRGLAEYSAASDSLRISERGRSLLSGLRG
jgi:hypothetical protein